MDAARPRSSSKVLRGTNELVSDGDIPQELAKLKEVFLLLEPNQSSLTPEEKVKQENLLQLFTFYVQCSRRISDYHHLNRPVRTQVNFSNVVPRFMQLLRECVLSHQWQDALKLVQVLSKEPKGADTTIWKVGLTCLYQDGRRSQRLAEQFVRQLCVLQKLAIVEVMLDYLLFLLTRLDINDAKQLMQELKQNTGYRTQLTTDKRKQSLTLFFAYQGLALYADWKLAIFRAEEEENEKDLISYMLSQGSRGQAARSIANEAVELLLTIQDKPGVWDIFIARVVELYEYYGKITEARSLLEEYRKKNPTNPNAHRYLYEFEERQDGESKVQIDCLIAVLKLDPCNPLCLKLYNLIESDNPRAVTLLFNFLDYSHCQDNEEVWNALATKLEQMENDTRLKQLVRKCWDTRSDWWPTVMFQNLNSLEVNSEQLRSRRKVEQVLLTL